MNPLIGGALIGLGGSVLGSIFNGFSNKSANSTNIKLAREQRAWNEKMWYLNNKYNTPLAQMQRYTEAGLNPNLMYGQGNSGNASSPAQGVDAPTVRPNWNLDSQMVGEALQLSSQMKVNDSVVEKNIQDAAKARAEAGVADTNKLLLETSLSRMKQLLPYELEKFNYDNSILGFNARKQYDRYDREVLGWEAKNANDWATNAKIKSDTQQVDLFIKQMPQRLKNDTIRAIASQTSANASVLAAKAQRTMADIAGGQLDLAWTRNAWESKRASVLNQVSAADIRVAGATYSKLLAEGRGQELQNELTEKFGAVEKAAAIANTVANTANQISQTALNTRKVFIPF